MEEVLESTKQFFLAVCEYIKKANGIDIIAIGNSLIFRFLLILYIVSLIVFIVQKIRKKHRERVEFVEFALESGRFLACIIMIIYTIATVKKASDIKVQLFVGAIFLTPLFLWLILDFGKKLVKSIKEYGWIGGLYYYAQIGFGIVGIIILLVNVTIAIMPIMLLCCLFIVGMVWNHDEDYRQQGEDWNEYKNDDWLE